MVRDPEAWVNHLLSSNELSGTVNVVLLRGASTRTLVAGLESTDAGLKVDRDSIRVSALEVLKTKRAEARAATKAAKQASPSPRPLQAGDGTTPLTPAACEVVARGPSQIEDVA